MSIRWRRYTLEIFEINGISFTQIYSFLIFTAQKMNFFFQLPADFVTFTEKHPEWKTLFFVQ